jgi:hypothetical protein
MRPYMLVVQFDTILLSIPFGVCVANIIPRPYLRDCATSDSVCRLGDFHQGGRIKKLSARV